MIAQWQYHLDMLDRDWLRTRGWPVIRDVARFWSSRATYDAQRKRYDILHARAVHTDGAGRAISYRAGAVRLSGPP